MSGTTDNIQAAYEYCRQLATTHYENFSVASLLIPKTLRQDFFNIYAFCRWSDDLADEQPSPDIALSSLKAWRNDLHQALADQPTASPILTALTDTVKRRNLTTKPLFDLLDAFERDQIQNRYRSQQDLLTYCHGSANPVGRLVLNLAGVTSSRELSLSDEICTGLQLVNFCQDMQRDAALNRIYMPEEVYSKFGISESTILAGKVTRELQFALRDWVVQSRQHFIRGWELWRTVPRWLARDIHLFASGGLAICDAIAQQNFDVWTRRPTVGKGTKLKLLTRACLTHQLPKSRFFSL